MIAVVYLMHIESMTHLVDVRGGQMKRYLGEYAPDLEQW
jgi:hypothetical protein